MKNNFESYHIRKWFSLIDETLATESGESADGATLIKYVVAAAVNNPYAGTFGQDLGQIVDNSDALGREFGRRIQALSAHTGASVVSYGKSCLVGLNGDYEHGNAFLTKKFATPVREALGGGKAWIPSSGKRGAPGSSIDIPLAHKDALFVRSHYDTITASFPDAPGQNEVVVIVAFASRGRLHARLGGLKAEDVVGDDGLR